MNTTLPLFYQKPVILNKVEHANWYIEEKESFSYAHRAHAIRLNLSEFAGAVSHYPILFANEGDNWFAFALTGLRTGQNLFVNEQGTWEKQTYIPAYVRRYPFIPAQTDTDTLLMSIDQAYPGLNQQNQGQALFIDGEMSEYAKQVRGFLENYESQAKLTSAYITELAQLKLLKKADANVTLPGEEGTKLQIQGFFIVDREKINALADQEIAQLVRQATLDHIIIHLHSLHAFHHLMARAAKIN